VLLETLAFGYLKVAIKLTILIEEGFEIGGHRAQHACSFLNAVKNKHRSRIQLIT
jgi:hypothetical protein